MKKNFIVILVLLLLAIFISGCIGFLTTPGEDSTAPGKGRLEIYLTDSSEKYKVNDPENFSAVYITISRIQVHLAGENEEDEGEWIWVLGEESNNDLIIIEELTDNFILLSEIELAQGKYTQIRLFITEASVLIEPKSKENKLIDVETNGEPVEIPSNLQTGLKLIHPFEIVDGGETVLTIYFNAEESIIKTGNGSYKLVPVIKIVTISAGETEEPVEE